jgi:hexosaminidase
MKKVSLLSICCLMAFLSFAQNNKSGLAIIPEPVSVITKDGEFTLPKHILIQAGPQADVKLVTGFLRNKLSASTGLPVTVRNAFSVPATIKLILNTKADTVLGKEGYHLYAGKKGIVIVANEAGGLFYGVQTLLQLLPKEVESAEVVPHFIWTVPLVDITDYPRFKWRGLMLDVSRHFFTKEEVEQYIDQMVRYKFNVLHMHLTDDEGWRVEIKSLPRLTTVGAYNVKKVGEFGRFSTPKPDEPRTYGGFYTQNDIKELVQYAKDRFMNIMPEIDVPGHSMAAVVSYPELSCTPGADKYVVRSGERQNADNTLNPASEKTYAFLDKVVTEVAQLFPFAYMHMGGDECNKAYWKKSDSVTALMKRENLTTYEQVQSYC